MARDFIHEVLNIVFPLTTVISLLVIFPPYLVFKLLSYIKRSIFSEDVAGKVVLITGASSGIGEGLAYEYAKRGARLAIVARRKDRLQLVAAKARELGSPDVYVIRADIAKVNECQELVEKAVKHFGQLDHLVNNAGIVRVELFEDCRLFDSASVLDVNFWGAIYCTRFAISHLRKSKGKIAVNSSLAAWSPVPRTALYSASKAALVSFYEALRNECGSDIGITIVLLGLIESEMTAPDAASRARLEPAPYQVSPAARVNKKMCRSNSEEHLPWRQVLDRAILAGCFVYVQVVVSRIIRVAYSLDFHEK
ncbi:RETINOL DEHYDROGENASE-RELATED [Salix koriyanagi]|uniref:RETINOL DEHYDROGENASE-RELATED n=1 Tax=Salix koriyanagi TaxID=2511006 RepID=A0A9Q0VF38_9ROSI|nr:RETINOL DEHYDROGENASE-RELATED [Salix koriyanagi]